MQPSERAQATSARLLITALAAAGFVLTLLVYYPGIMNYDARFILSYVNDGVREDWQSPVMIALWALINPLVPGSASMFLLIAGLYWLAFGLLARTIANRSPWLAILLLLLAVSPPAFLFVGTIWRDVLFAAIWLLAGALCFAVVNSSVQWRVPAQALALVLIAFGVLLRPNAVFAAPFFTAYALWPARFYWKRTVLLIVPVGIALAGLTQFIFYGVIDAQRKHIEQSIMIFDLGGISHFAKENQFPVTWTAEQEQRLLNTCYRPQEWDGYWRIEPCEFVMDKVEKELHLFGTSAIPRAWLRAIVRHPIAYLEHRVAYTWNFLAHDNITMWRWDTEDASKLPLGGRPSIVVMAGIDSALKQTPLLRVGTWLLLCLAVCAIGWRRRDTPAGAFALGLGGSGAVYVLTFFGLGVAPDFRYGYWGAIAGLAGAVVLAAGSVTRRAP